MLLKKLFLAALFFIVVTTSNAQLAWPSSTWNSAQNLTSVMSTSGVEEASGLYWNKVQNRLYLVQNDGNVRILQYNTTTNTFSNLANKSITGGPEGITVVNDNENVFYTIDEDSYKIHKYTHTSNFSTVTLSNEWNLLQSPSPMSDTGNTGPEGICFVSDVALQNVNFVSQATNLPYTSQKGMNGLIFIAHQDAGYIWVFDVNPNLSNDFLYVGKYKTNRSESCDLAFDNSIGMLYILHNTGSNYLEVTDLTTSDITGNGKQFNLKAEYLLPTPTNNTNIEGFAITEKCPATNTVSAWLCRDASSSDNTSVKTDVLRWFSPFASYGDCGTLDNATVENTFEFLMFPNPTNGATTIDLGQIYNAVDLKLYNSLGQIIFTNSYQNTNQIQLNIETETGFYFIELNTNDGKRGLLRVVKE